jgi:hypothetical protein
VLLPIETNQACLTCPKIKKLNITVLPVDHFQHLKPSITGGKYPNRWLNVSASSSADLFKDGKVDYACRNFKWRERVLVKSIGNF